MAERGWEKVILTLLQQKKTTTNEFSASILLHILSHWACILTYTCMKSQVSLFLLDTFCVWITIKNTQTCHMKHHNVSRTLFQRYIVEASSESLLFSVRTGNSMCGTPYNPECSFNSRVVQTDPVTFCTLSGVTNG